MNKVVTVPVVFGDNECDSISYFMLEAYKLIEVSKFLVVHGPSQTLSNINGTVDSINLNAVIGIITDIKFKSDIRIDGILMAEIEMIKQDPLFNDAFDEYLRVKPIFRNPDCQLIGMEMYVSPHNYYSGII